MILNCFGLMDTNDILIYSFFRVYYSETDYYTMHHLIMVVDEGSLGYESGLRPGDLITHINGESVQVMIRIRNDMEHDYFHTQVLQLLLTSLEHVTLRATPLKNTR